MRSPRGITSIELTIVIAVLATMFGASAMAYSRLQRSTALAMSDREVMNILTVAARRARSGMHGSDWGVYIPYDESTRKSTTAVVFAGESYATRNAAYDLPFTMNDDVSFTSVNWSGTAPDVTNSHEIVFQTQTGATDDFGSLELRWFETSRTIIIHPNGMIVRQ